MNEKKKLTSQKSWMNVSFSFSTLSNSFSRTLMNWESKTSLYYYLVPNKFTYARNTRRVKEGKKKSKPT